MRPWATPAPRAQVAFVMFDGSDPNNKEKRNAFWEISGKRAIYPQVCSFVLGAPGRQRPASAG